jgi:signal transduction histidine kinase
MTETMGGAQTLGWSRLGIRPWWVFDIGVTVAVLLFSLPSVIHVHDVVRPLLLTIGLATPLLFRRRHPRVVFVVIALVAFVQWLLGVKIAADAALLVALYTVASIESLPLTGAAVAVVEVGCVLAAARWSSSREGPGVLLGFILLSGLTSAASMSGFYIRTRRAYLLQLEDRAARLELERDQQGALAVAAERERIARDMHDILAHHLTVMVTVSEGAAAAVARTPNRAIAAMHAVAAEGRQALRDTRGLLGVLRDEPAGDDREPLPDLSRLDELVDQVRRTGRPVVLTIEGRLEDLPAGLPLTIYRLVQETLTNVMKHSTSGAEARIQIRARNDSVLIDIADDGPAVPGSGPQDDGGHGISGMRERVLAWGGQISVGPTATGGWRVRAVLPCPPAASTPRITTDAVQTPSHAPLPSPR